MSTIYDIEIANFNSAGIRAEAARSGVTHMRHLGSGYAGGSDDADARVDFYALNHPKFGEFRVADTNGDPVWEECDAQAFADLAEECGVEI